jgi:uncharacterized protein
MEALPEKIIHFFEEHHVLTLATTVDNQPYCANCFYVFDGDHSLIFASEHKTKHIQDAVANPLVAASIVLETCTVGKIQGIQLCGRLIELSGEELSHAKKKYLKAFPYAVLKQTPLWALKLSYAKMTDNRLGFGKKLIWGELTA